MGNLHKEDVKTFVKSHLTVTNEKLSIKTLIIYHILLKHRNHTTGCSFVSYSYLTENFGYGRGLISKSLKELEALYFIKIQKAPANDGHFKNVYSFPLFEKKQFEKLPEEFIYSPELTDIEKAFLICAYPMMQDDTTFKASNAEIAEILGVSLRTIARDKPITSLIEKGWLNKIKIRLDGSLVVGYQLNKDKMLESCREIIGTSERKLNKMTADRDYWKSKAIKNENPFKNF